MRYAFPLRAANSSKTAKGRNMINVMDYGAVPNDGKDDTDAIEKALAASQKLKKGMKPEHASYILVSPASLFSVRSLSDITADQAG